MSIFSPSGSKEDTTTLHVLGLLKELMGTFPLGAVKSCCETLLRVMTLSHVVRTQQTFIPFNHLYGYSNVVLNMAAVFLVVAGDGERHAGLSQAIQREAKRINPLPRAQRADHHGERTQTKQMHQSLNGKCCVEANGTFLILRLCTTTCPVRTTCSLCWPGSLSWRKHMFTWRGNKLFLTTAPQILSCNHVIACFLDRLLNSLCALI